MDRLSLLDDHAQRAAGHMRGPDLLGARDEGRADRMGQHAELAQRAETADPVLMTFERASNGKREILRCR